MSDMGWTRYMDSQEEIASTCKICGESGAEVEVSNGPGEPINGVVHEDCGQTFDSQALEGADHYHIDWDEPVGLDF